MTGQKMSHYVIAGGRFEQACQVLLNDNFHISWADRHIPIEALNIETVAALRKTGLDLVIPTLTPLGEDDDREAGEPIRPKKRPGRIKFTCPKCGANAWAKPDLNILCGSCHVAFEAQSS